jgi:DNA replication and repair protein RecF
MRIFKLKIRNIRNHSRTEISLAGGLNIFYGLNGSGKTTILESVSLCGFSKSFLPVSDSSLINVKENSCSVSAEAVNDMELGYKISLDYETGKKKRISTSYGDNLLAKDIIGDMPMVVLSPDFKIITFGAPENRRNFIDRLLSQASKIYKSELYRYRKALKQRNIILANLKNGGDFDERQLMPWTEMLISSGSEVILRRIDFINEFRGIFKEIYKEVSSNKEEVDLDYEPFGFGDVDKNSITLGDIKKRLLEIYKSNVEEELYRGMTLFGPHKDDLKIFINGSLAKEYASQGQHKSLLISIKIGEFHFLKAKRNETPVVLLDDFFSELDEQRMNIIFEIVKRNSAQTLITITNPDNLIKIVGRENGCRYFEVRNGMVHQEV